MSMISPGQFRPSFSSAPNPTPTPTSITSESACISAAVLLVIFWWFGMFEAALIGGLAGLIAGWVQRAFRIRSHLAKHLIESLFSSEFWNVAAGTALAHMLIHLVVGLAVAGILAAMHGSVAVEGISTLAGGGGSGPPPPAAIAMFLLVAAIIAAILFAIFNLIFGGAKILLRMKQQRVSDSRRGEAAALFLHKPEAAALKIADQVDLRVKMIWPSVVEGAISGALVGMILIGLGWGR